MAKQLIDSALLCALALFGAGCGDDSGTGTGSEPAREAETTTSENVVNIYNWSDYIAEDTIANFERETGIKVRYDVFDSNEVVEAKLLAGTTGVGYNVAKIKERMPDAPLGSWDMLFKPAVVAKSRTVA